jgi:hypothetical protein
MSVYYKPKGKKQRCLKRCLIKNNALKQIGHSITLFIRLG